jgi:hypothetical protein
MTRSLAAFFGVLLLVACAAPAGPTPGPASPPPRATPTPATPAPGTPAPETPDPTPPTDTSFYLRLWYSQALPPPETFGWLPPVTIVDGSLIDGNVAIPMIYPGPLLIQPNARFISDAGMAAIVAEADRFGLLGERTDFLVQPVPGARIGHLLLRVDGRDHELIGDPEAPVDCAPDGRCDAEPGSPGAFAAFWQQLMNIDGWLGGELGGHVPYEPERMAVLVTEPVDEDPQLPQPGPADWPLETPFAEFGMTVPSGASDRCGTVSGDDLDLLVPVLQASNQLTVFIDSEGVERSVVPRILVPGEPSPCADEG